MYRKIFVPIIGVMLLTSGCGKAVSGTSHPSYTIFKHVPAAQVKAIKKSIKKAGVKHIELPTKMPYTVTAAHCPNPPSAPGPSNITIYIGTKKRQLGIEAWSDPANKPVTEKNVSMMNEQVTKLSKGTKALYGHNAHVSQLAWVQNSVRYFLSSNTIKNKPDLTEKQLIQVANSFQ